MHYNALTLTSNSMTEQEYWFFDSDSSSNQSVQSLRCVWILLVMVASASSLHIQLLSSNYSVYFNSYIPTHHQDLHIRSQRAKQKQTTWNTTHPRWLQEAKPTSKPHEIHRINTHWTVLRKEKTNETIWTLPNLIPHAVPLFISILQRFDSTYLKMNETISIFGCQRIWFHAQMIHLFSFNYSIFSTNGQQQRFFPSPDSLAVLLARIANPALQSAWQECHLFPKGSVMLIRRLLNFLLALINALFLHCWRPVFHLSRHQVWCSNAATFQPAC